MKRPIATLGVALGLLVSVMAMVPAPSVVGVELESIGTPAAHAGENLYEYVWTPGRVRLNPQTGTSRWSGPS